MEFTAKYAVPSRMTCTVCTHHTKQTTTYSAKLHYSLLLHYPCKRGGGTHEEQRIIGGTTILFLGAVCVQHSIGYYYTLLAKEGMHEEQRIIGRTTILFIGVVHVQHSGGKYSTPLRLYI